MTSNANPIRRVIDWIIGPPDEFDPAKGTVVARCLTEAEAKETATSLNRRGEPPEHTYIAVFLDGVWLVKRWPSRYIPLTWDGGGGGGG